MQHILKLGATDGPTMKDYGYVGGLGVHHKKVLDYDQDEFYHRGEEKLQKSVQITDEISYINWYDSLCSNIYRNQRYAPYVVLDLIPIDEFGEYDSCVVRAESQCCKNPGASALLNDWIFATTDPKYYWLISPTLSCNQNLERLKLHFHDCINAFYLLKKEQELRINLTNVCKFLVELDNMQKLFKFVFRESPTPSLVLQWIMAGVNRNPVGNSLLLTDIQANWEHINKDPVYIRHILFNHVKSRKRKAM